MEKLVEGALQRYENPADELAIVVRRVEEKREEQPSQRRWRDGSGRTDVPSPCREQERGEELAEVKQGVPSLRQ